MTANELIVIRIEKLLKEKNCTIKEVEKRANISHKSMIKLMNKEYKRITLSLIFKLAKGFQMEFCDFLKDELFNQFLNEITF